MTGPVATVRVKVPESCAVTTISKEHCNIRLGRVPAGGERLILDFDKPSPHWDANRERRCDYLFLEEIPDEPGRVRPIELKGNSFRASTVIAQLQTGANIAERLIPPGCDVDVQAILASGSLPKAERKVILNATIRFRGKAKPMKRIRCGADLP